MFEPDRFDIDVHVPMYPHTRETEYPPHVFKNAKYRCGQMVMVRATRANKRVLKSPHHCHEINATSIEDTPNDAIIVDRALDIKNENVIVRVHFTRCDTCFDEWIDENDHDRITPTTVGGISSSPNFDDTIMEHLSFLFDDAYEEDKLTMKNSFLNRRILITPLIVDVTQLLPVLGDIIAEYLF